jgi:CSLREA domain-containing protein
MKMSTKFLVIPAIAVASCTVNLTDETSDNLSFNPPTNLQPFRAEVSKRGSVTVNGVTVNLQNGGSAALNGSGVGMWQGQAGVPPCEQVVSYNFVVDFYRGSSTNSKFKTFPETGMFIRTISNTDPVCNGILSASKTFNVTTTEDLPDINPGDGVCATDNSGEASCSLRAAVMEANAKQGVDAINLPNGRYLLTREKPNGVEGDATPEDAWGDLDITDSVAIIGTPSSTIHIGNFMMTQPNGFGSNNLVAVEGDINATGTDSIFPKVDGGEIDRVFQVHEINGNEGFVFLKNIAIRNGHLVDRPGAGIFNQGVLTLERVAIYDNTASKSVGGGVNDQNRGAGIYNAGILVAKETAIVNNKMTESGGFAGGLFAAVGSQTDFDKSLIAFNSAQRGAAIFIESNSELPNVNLPRVQLTTSTVYGNEANGSSTHTVINFGLLGLNFATVANNNPGGVSNNSGGTLSIANSFLASDFGNFSDCGGPFISLGGNIIQDSTCSGSANSNDLVNPTNQLFIDPLAYRGGFTYVMPIRPPASSNPVDPTDRIASPFDSQSNDQRGFARPYDADGSGTAEHDVGAYEFDGSI